MKTSLIPLLGCLPLVASAPDLNSMGRHSESDSSSDYEEGEGDSQKVDKVYTVGCFDLFHRGHEKLLKLMRTMGREVNTHACNTMVMCITFQYTHPR